MSDRILRSRRSPHASSSDETPVNSDTISIIPQQSKMASAVAQPFSANDVRESLAGRLVNDRLEQLRDEGMELYRVRQGGGARDEVGGARGGILSTHWSVVERPLCDGDTLANIALRYNCSIDDLKRVNRIMRDQELFALRTVRIPVLRHGVVEELLAEEDRDRASTQLYKERRKTGSCSDTDYALSDDDNIHFLRSSRLKLISQSDTSQPHADPTHTENIDESGINRIFQSVDDDLRSVTEALLNNEGGFEDGGNADGRLYRRRRGPSHDGVSFLGGYISSRTVILMVIAIGAGVPVLFGLVFLVNSFRGGS